MMKLPIAGLALLSVACAPVPPPPDAIGPGPFPAPAPGGGLVEACDAASSQSLLGQVGNASVAEQARRRSGANVMRFLRPGQIVTMEYRADRLNIVLDRNGRVEAIRCG